MFFFFFSSRRRHTRLQGDWSSDVCSSDLRRSRRPGPVEQRFTARVAPGAEVPHAEIVDSVVDPLLAIDIDVEQLRPCELDARDACGPLGVGAGEGSPWHGESPRGARVRCEYDRHLFSATSRIMRIAAAPSTIQGLIASAT